MGGIVVKLTDSQLLAINTLDENLEIIACAGSGKTGVVTRRIVNILKTKRDLKPENIVAFTFTEKAADELKNRIYKYVKEEIGEVNGLAEMYVGTVHGFCLKLLQDYVSIFQKFTVLDSIKTKLFIDKNYDSIGMKNLGMRRFKETGLFMSIISALNESKIDNDKISEKLIQVQEKYCEIFYSNNYFDFSLILKEALNQLQINKELRDKISNRIKYLTVDEYQDINPIQEKLIKTIYELGANLCIVGDDDQTIYQFRGSDSSNILTFKNRYNVGKSIVLDDNFRSTKGIVDIAHTVIKNNIERLNKKMVSSSELPFEEGDIVYKEFGNIVEEFDFIAKQIIELRDSGVKFSDMAILLRMKKFGSELVNILDKYRIPYIVEGVNELFLTPEALASKMIFDFLKGDVDEKQLLDAWLSVKYRLKKNDIENAIQDLKNYDVAKIKFYHAFVLQQIFHDFISQIELKEEEGSIVSNTEIILYNLGKFSQVIHDFETIYFASAPAFKLACFCSFLEYTAQDYYPEGHMQNTYIRPDAINIMTVHQSKGLEFSAVFVPQMNHNIFPAQKIGGKNIWHYIPREAIVNSSRYDGTLEDERRLFYVAVTRSKKFLYLTRSPYKKNSQKPSEFFIEVKHSKYIFEHDETVSQQGKVLPISQFDEKPIGLNFSILQDYFDCKYRFKITFFYGFVQPLVAPMGYGRSLHNIVMDIHRRYVDGKLVQSNELNNIVNTHFYLPYANAKMKILMQANAERSIEDYYNKNLDYFGNIRFVEKDIELDLGNNIRVNGRVDLVKRKEIGEAEKTFIVDFKTAHRSVVECIGEEQLKIYALGYKELTGEHADFIEIYNLDNNEQSRKKVNERMLGDTEEKIILAANNIRRNKLEKKCSKEKCSNCYMMHLCISNEKKKLLNIE
ncbi:ATP-dependent helicase [Clostridium botulinum]|nr:ATP-dependent helicase [Clostridium botulinum]